MTVISSSMACRGARTRGRETPRVADLSAAGRVRLGKPPEQYATSARSISLSRDFPRHACLLVSYWTLAKFARRRRRQVVRTMASLDEAAP